MSTLNQIDANRRNAEHSTGPRTPEGKAASSHNALKHGLTSAQIVLPTESQAEFDELANELREEYQPDTPSESLLVDQLIAASWKLRRVRAAEAHFYQTIDSATDPLIDDPKLERLARHEARIERSFYRALHELQRIQRERRKAEPALKKEQNEPKHSGLSIDLFEVLGRKRPKSRSFQSDAPDDDDSSDPIK